MNTFCARSRVLAPSLAGLVHEAVSFGEIFNFYTNLLENRYPPPIEFSSGLMNLRPTTVNTKGSKCM